jgi:hypothetical protein
MAYFRLGVSLFFALWCYPSAPGAACVGVETLPNRVVVLVDGREETSFETSRIARKIAGPLAQKGLYPLYVDVAKPLPATLDTSPIAGVMSWFATDVPDAQKVADWLAARDNDCGTTLPHVAIGEMGGTPIWHRFGADPARAAILHGGERDKIQVAQDWVDSQTPVEVAPGVVVAPVLPSGGDPIVLISAEDGLQHVLGFQRDRHIWLSDRLMQDQFGTTKTAINLDRVLAPFKSGDLSPVPDLAMFQGRRIALSVLLSDGWELRTSPSESTSLGIPAYALVQRIFLADAAPVTFGWPDPTTQEPPSETNAAAAIKTLTKAAQIHSLPRTGARGPLSFGSPMLIELLPASIEGSDASPLPDQSAIIPLAGPAGFGDPTGLHARAAAVARSDRPWPSAPDTLVVRAKDLLTEAGQIAVAQARALHASPDRAAINLTQYAELLKGALSTQIKPLGSHIWQITNRGALHTLRFERRGNLTLNIESSTGVLGSWIMGSALFVALDPAVGTALIALRAEHSAPNSDAQTLELVEAGPKLKQLHRNGCRGSALIEGSGQVTVRAQLEPQIFLGGDRLPVTPLPNNLWRFKVPDHLASLQGLSFAVGCS